MALRNQPYLPLYVQDFLTDEKLAECSAESTGVYIRLMCLMHKSEEYGIILLKQKDKQNTKQINNFAYKLAKQMPYSMEVIEQSLSELLEENVLILDEDKLIQKRMVRDNSLSEIRSKAGKKGGEEATKKKEDFAYGFAQAKVQANTENEIVIVNENINNIYSFIEENFGRTLSSIEYQEIGTWEDNELTRYAIKQAILNGKYNIKYIQTILRSYKTSNITTIQQAQEDEDNFKRQKDKQYKSYKTSSERTQEVFDRFLKKGDSND